VPGLSGYQICERIKQSDETQKIPVILLVGSFEPFDEAEAYRVGADDYLTKPFQSIRQLVTKVSDLLESVEPAKENSPAETEAKLRRKMKQRTCIFSIRSKRCRKSVRWRSGTAV
jgi:DNA-binding response OmpR family regulator